MNRRLEQLAKWASLIALIVLIGALVFNKQTIGENKIMAGLFSNPANWAITDAIQGQDNTGSGSGIGGGGGGTWAGETGGTVNPNNPYNIDFNQSTGGQYVLNPANGGGGPAVPTAEQQAQTNARNQFNQGRDVFNTSVNQAIQNSGQGFQRGMQDTINNWNSQQQGLDTRGVNNVMAKSQGLGGIMKMVGQGIRSAGTMLGNRNAGSSR